MGFVRAFLSTGAVAAFVAFAAVGSPSVRAQTSSCAAVGNTAAVPGLTAGTITVDAGTTTGIVPVHGIVPMVDGDQIVIHVPLTAAAATTTQVIAKDDQGQPLDSVPITLTPNTEGTANLVNVGALPSMQLQCLSLWAGIPSKAFTRLYFLELPARVTLADGTDAADDSISGISARAPGVYQFTNIGIDKDGHLVTTAHLASDTGDIKWKDLRLRFDGDVDPTASSFDVAGRLTLPQALGNSSVTLPHINVTAAQIATSFTDQKITKFLGLAPAQLSNANLVYTFADKKFAFSSSVDAQLAPAIGTAAQAPAPDATPAGNAIHSTDTFGFEENGERLGVKGNFKLAGTLTTTGLALLYLNREQFQIDSLTTAGSDTVSSAAGQQYFHASGKVQFVSCLFNNPLTFNDLTLNASGDSQKAVSVPEVIKIGFITMPKVAVLMRQWKPFFTIEVYINNQPYDTIVTPAPVSAADIIKALRNLFKIRKNTLIDQAATAVQNACASVQNETR